MNEHTTLGTKCRGIGLVTLMLVAAFATTFALPVAAAGTTDVSISPVDESVDVGGTQTYEIVVEDAKDGIRSYDIDVSLSDGSVATITSVDAKVSGQGTDETVSSDGDSATVATYSASSTEGEVVVATVTLKGDAEGTTILDFDSIQIFDENGDEYDPGSVDNARFNVGGEGYVDVSLSPESQKLDGAGNVQLDLVVEGPEDGVGSFDITVSSSDTTAATIEEVDITGVPEERQSTKSSGGGKSIRAKAIGLDTAEGEDLTVTIATVTVNFQNDAGARISVTPDVIGDEQSEGYRIDDVTDAELIGSDGSPPPEDDGGDTNDGTDDGGDTNDGTDDGGDTSDGTDDGGDTSDGTNDGGDSTDDGTNDGGDSTDGGDTNDGTDDSGSSTSGGGGGGGGSAPPPSGGGGGGGGGAPPAGGGGGGGAAPSGGSNAAPEFVVTDATLQNASILAGESATVAATVENVGNASGRYEANLTVNGRFVTSRFVTVGEGQTKEVLITRFYNEPGNYSLAVGDASAGALLVEPRPTPTPTATPEPTPTPSATPTPGGTATVTATATPTATPEPTPTPDPAVQRAPATDAAPNVPGVNVLFPDGPVSNITFDAEADGSVSVEALDEPPAEFGTPDGELLDATRIEVPSSLEDRAATIRFTVTNERLDAAGVQPEAVQLHRYSDGAWRALSTTVVGRTADGYLLEAETPGFSVFAMSATDAEERNSVDDSGGTPTEAQAQEAPGTTPGDQAQFGGTTPGPYMLVGAALVVLLLGVVGVRRRYWRD